MRFLHFVFVLMCASVATSFAQAPGGSLGVTGTVSAAWMMEPVKLSSENAAASLQQMDRQSVLVDVAAGNAQGQMSRVQIIVAIRTNARQFRIRAERVNCSQIPTVSVGAPAPAGAGSLVNPAAFSSFAGSSEVSLNAPADIATGPRISLGGRFTSPENALLVPLTVQLPDSKAPCSVRLSISE